MKTTITLLLLSVFSNLSLAQNRTISIYQNSGASVVDVYSENLTKGTNLFTYENLVSGYNNQSFFVFVDESPAQFTFKEGADFNDFILSYKGETITVSERDGETYTGKLIDYRFGSYFIELSDKSVIYLNSNQSASVRFPNLHSGFSEKDQIQVLTTSKNTAEKSIRVSYESNAFNWEPVYSLVLAEDEKSASFQGLAKFTYRGTEQIESAYVRFNYGNLNNSISNSYRPKPTYRNKMSSLEMLDTETQMDLAVVSSESVGDNYEFVIEKPLRIEKNQIQHVILFDVNDVPIQKRYEYNLSIWNVKKTNPIVMYSFDYNKKNGFQHQATSGKIDVLIYNNNKDLRNLADSKIQNTSLEELVELNLGKAMDIDISETVTASEQVTKKLSTASYKIEVKNDKKEKITIHLIKQIDRSTIITDSNKKFETDSAFKAIFTLEIKPGKSEVITLSTKTEYK